MIYNYKLKQAGMAYSNMTVWALSNPQAKSADGPKGD